MTLKVVVFNGPPRCGKNIAAEYMTNLINNTEGDLPAFHKTFKDELIKLCANMLGKSVNGFMKNYDSKTEDVVNPYPLERLPEWYKDYTGTITQRVCNTQYSKREFLIHMSENVIKPSFGEDAFGKAFVKSLPEEGVVFVSDSGFEEELKPVIKYLGKDSVLVVKINSEGCSFEGDSRTYLDKSKFLYSMRPDFCNIDNNATEEEFLNKVEKVIGDWL